MDGLTVVARGTCNIRGGENSASVKELYKRLVWPNIWMKRMHGESLFWCQACNNNYVE